MKLLGIKLLFFTLVEFLVVLILAEIKWYVLYTSIGVTDYAVNQISFVYWFIITIQIVLSLVLIFYSKGGSDEKK